MNQQTTGLVLQAAIALVGCCVQIWVAILQQRSTTTRELQSIERRREDVAARFAPHIVDMAMHVAATSIVLRQEPTGPNIMERTKLPEPDILMVDDDRAERLGSKLVIAVSSLSFHIKNYNAATSPEGRLGHANAVMDALGRLSDATATAPLSRRPWWRRLAG